jgi:recombinational DNA repair ATPase RecF
MNTYLRIDVRGLTFAVVIGIAYLALGSALPLAAGAGALVYALNALFTRPATARRPKLPALPPGTPETAWVDRALFAVASIDQLRSSARSDAIAERCAAIAVQARLAVTSLHRLAYQASVVAGMTQSTDMNELRAAEERCRAQLSHTTGPARIELERNVASLTARRESAERLESTRRDIGGRVQSGALGLEGVVARVAEIVAITDDTSRLTPIDELASELDALREALVASEVIGDQAFDTAVTAGQGER